MSFYRHLMLEFYFFSPLTEEVSLCFGNCFQRCIFSSLIACRCRRVVFGSQTPLDHIHFRPIRTSKWIWAGEPTKAHTS